MTGERVLIVDDDERLRDVIDQYLRSEGYLTLTAVDGPEAVRGRPLYGDPAGARSGRGGVNREVGSR